MNGIFNNNSSATKTQVQPGKVPRSGYDLPVYGLASGQFLAIHIPALTCIFLSLLSAIGVLFYSFKTKNYHTFFTWTKSERFVVYLAVCDGLFNICHSMDHLHILVTEDFPTPRGLCEFYGFMLAEFITAQNLMVNVVSINAFVLIFFRRNINFGKWDHRLLLWTFGVPFVAAIVALALETMGPNGTFCYFDGVKGEIANLLFTTVPLTTILVMNIILYALTWRRIKQEEPKFKGINGRDAQVVRASHRAARTMSLFVTAFFIQWWAMCIYGIVQIASTVEVPIQLFQFVTTFSNIGGILNGIVYIIIRRRSKEKHSDASLELSNSANGKKFSRMYNSNSHASSAIGPISNSESMNVQATDL